MFNAYASPTCAFGKGGGSRNTWERGDVRRMVATTPSQQPGSDTYFERYAKYRLDRDQPARGGAARQSLIADQYYQRPDRNADQK